MFIKYCSEIYRLLKNHFIEKSRIKTLLINQKGATMAIIAIAMVGILGSAALVTDIGLAYVQKTKLSSAVDAAALAAAQDIIISSDKARETAIKYLNKNGFGSANMKITASSENRTVEILGMDTVDFYFAKALGFSTAKLDAGAKASIMPITEVNGVRPLAMEDFPFQYGVLYTLKEGAGDSYNGNFGPVSLGDSGAYNYRNNLKYGYNGGVKVGDYIYTETGNMPTPTQEGLEYLMNQCSHVPKCTISSYNRDCSRLITIPVLETLKLDGKGQVKVVSFAKFLISENYISGGHMEIKGWFIKSTVKGNGNPGGLDRGLYTVKLVK